MKSSNTPENMKKIGSGTKFTANNQPAKRGRSKKIDNQLRELFNEDLTPEELKGLKELSNVFQSDLKKDDWLEIITKIMEKTGDQVDALSKNTNLPIGFRIIARSLQKAAADGDPSNFLALFARKYGQPHQHVTGPNTSVNQINFNSINMTAEEGVRMYLSAMKDIKLLTGATIEAENVDK